MTQQAGAGTAYLQGCKTPKQSPDFARSKRTTLAVEFPVFHPDTTVNRSGSPWVNTAMGENTSEGSLSVIGQSAFPDFWLHFSRLLGTWTSPVLSRTLREAPAVIANDWVLYAIH